MDDRIEDLEEQVAKAHTIIQRLEEKIRSVEEQENIESAKLVFPATIYLILEKTWGTHSGTPFFLGT